MKVNVYDMAFIRGDEFDALSLIHTLLHIEDPAAEHREIRDLYYLAKISPSFKRFSDNPLMKRGQSNVEKLILRVVLREEVHSAREKYRFSASRLGSYLRKVRGLEIDNVIYAILLEKGITNKRYNLPQSNGNLEK